MKFFSMFIFSMIIPTLLAGKKKIQIKYKPLTSAQAHYQSILRSSGEFLVTAVGPPGTGKTMFACMAAAEKIKSAEIDKIIITRPTISVEEETLGFLPGSMEQKMAPWTRPIYDMFHEIFSKNEFDMMIKNNQIEVAPLAFMRGRTFKNAFVIADEMQNSTPAQMRMMLTRMGLRSQMVVTGDPHQSDILGKNGLVDLVEKMEKTPYPDYFHLVRLSAGDIQRSAIVTHVINMYQPTST